ncbi:Mlr8448 protein, partial [hydrothermal vent metagenome]
MVTKAAPLRRALDALYYSGAFKAMTPIARGRGAIFMLHRVLPDAHGTVPKAFDPNGFLAVSPDFLDRAIARARTARFDLVDLDEAARRLKTASGGRFACFTLDDGYRDNREHALEVFERHDCPFTVYVTSGFAGWKTDPWWILLERLIADTDAIAVRIGSRTEDYSCATVEEKTRTFHAISEQFAKASGPVFEAAMGGLYDRFQIERGALAQELIMGWAELAEFARHPLVTLGAHTVGHPVLANLDDAACRAQMAEGAQTMAARLGAAPRHIAYPYGHDWAAGPREFDLARQLGFATGVTTRKGLVFTEHADHLTALPRVSLNGDYQLDRYVDVLLS